MPIQIDGSFGEGGGQIIRTSLTMSAITGKPFEINHIRLNRKPKPYLRPQHLMAAQAVAAICQGELIGATLNEKSFSFYPGKIQGGEYVFDIKTAGSVILVAQTIIPILLFATFPSHVRIIGGTDLENAPAYDYFHQVFLKALTKFNLKINAKLIKPGYYPCGGGEIELNINPAAIHGCDDWEANEKEQALIRITNLPRQIAEREANIIKENHITSIDISEHIGVSPGNTITLWQNYKGTIGLGKRGKLAENVARDVIVEFKQENAMVDKHLADQLLIYAALAKGATSYTTSIMTNHLRTNAYVISHFLNRQIDIKDNRILIS